MTLHLEQVKSGLSTSDPWQLMSGVPTLLWFVDTSLHLDYWLDVIAWSGLVISVIMMVTGGGNWPLLATQVKLNNNMTFYIGKTHQ